jgi:hypothetical protein
MGGCNSQVYGCPNHLAHFFATVSRTLFLHDRVGDFFVFTRKNPSNPQLTQLINTVPGTLLVCVCGTWYLRLLFRLILLKTFSSSFKYLYGTVATRTSVCKVYRVQTPLRYLCFVGGKNFLFVKLFVVNVLVPCTIFVGTIYSLRFNCNAKEKKTFLFVIFLAEFPSSNCTFALFQSHEIQDQ